MRKIIKWMAGLFGMVTVDNKTVLKWHQFVRDESGREFTSEESTPKLVSCGRVLGVLDVIEDIEKENP